ncbi:MAG: adenylate/guanylate cyclase domain-containing protein [Desulfobacteraceae bacterium]
MKQPAHLRLFSFHPLARNGIICAVLILTAVLAATGPGREFNNYAQDLAFLIRGPKPPCKNIVVVAIDEASFGVIQQQWPWDRQVHAGLIENIYQDGAAVVALDIIFAETSDPVNDKALSKILSRYPQTLLAAYFDTVKTKAFDREILVTPHPDIAGSKARTGIINLPVDKSGIIRQSELNMKTNVSFALEACRSFKGKSKSAFADLPRKIRINYPGPPGTFQFVSYYQALDLFHLPRNFFKDKLVFVGAAALSADLSITLPDHFPVPWSRWNAGYMPGVEIHATIAANILQSDYIRDIDTWLIWLLSILSCLFPWYFSIIEKPGTMLAAWAVTSTITVTGFYFLFTRFNFYLGPAEILFPQTGIALTSSILHFLKIRQEKRFIHKAFSTYVSPQVVRELMDNPDLLTLGGGEREITAFFSDIQGFTRISETMTPTELVAFLNEFLSQMCDIILANQGTVDKFEGDAIIAFFGAPGILKDHAQKACNAVLQMHKRLDRLNVQWTEKGLPEIKMRIGLCTGKAIVGNMGTHKRMDYTMMGDTVNIAARLEGANKIYKIYSLAAESTVDMLDNTIITRKTDHIKVIGKTTPLAVYQLMDFAHNLSEHQMNLIHTYETGLHHYQKQEFKSAATCFSSVLKTAPSDGPAAVMLKRCAHFTANPPPPGWTGIFVQEKK